jgi:hypothetical protein
MIKVEDITSVVDVRANLQKCLDHELERKKVHTLVRLTLEQYEGKKLTKGIEKSLCNILPGYLVTYFVEMYHKKVTIRRRHGGNTEVFSETILVHSDHYGERFTMARFLDNDATTSYITARIIELQAMIAKLDETYPALVQKLTDFIAVQQQFRAEMKEFHALAHFMSDSEHDYIREHTKW